MVLTVYRHTSTRVQFGHTIAELRMSARERVKGLLVPGACRSRYKSGAQRDDPNAIDCHSGVDHEVTIIETVSTTLVVVFELRPGFVSLDTPNRLKRLAIT